MYIQQLYTNCLAEAAYYLESIGPDGTIEAVIIDPIRDIEEYLDLSRSRNSTIKYILETHFHADFVSGHLDLAAATGATIVFGPTAMPAYSVHVARDGERFSFGSATLETLHTPGHTPESTCFLLYDEEQHMKALFTGDTLFVGDVGRPDLLDGTMSKEELAGMMFDSLQRLRALPDALTVYPAHGPGSACGKNIGKETWTTLGVQKRTNYAMQATSREKFILDLTSGLAAPPPYYFADARINKSGYEPLTHVLAKAKLVNADAFEKLANDPLTVILDTREVDEFEAGHVPRAVSVGLSGTYAWWIGSLLPIETPIALVTEHGKLDESVRRLARVGYENILGCLAGGMNAWLTAGKPVEKTESIDPEDFDRVSQEMVVLDVRRPGECEQGRMEGAINIPLADLPKFIAETSSKEQPYLVHCAAGYRSMIAVSLMRRAGFTNLVNVRGGFAKLRSISSLVARIADPAEV
jgi:hydroxyacylglutathione hydrolase